MIPTQTKPSWTTAKVIALCCLLCGLTLYGATRFNHQATITTAAQTVPTVSKIETVSPPQQGTPESSQSLRVTQVDGGALLTLEDGTEVNLLGVSCPEVEGADPGSTDTAREAIAFTTGAVVGRQVRLEYEPAHLTDKKGRALAYVYLSDGTLLNAEIIKHGYGQAFIRYNYRFIDDFRKYESTARNSKLGVWENRDPESDSVVTENAGDSPQDSQVASPITETYPATQATTSRPRVILPPPTYPANNSQDAKTTSEPESSSPSIKPQPSYRSPSYVFPSAAPVSKPSVAENGSSYGEISQRTGRPKTVYVQSYVRRDGTYVRSHFRSSPRR
jgi:micrococcal nuclease